MRNAREEARCWKIDNEREKPITINYDELVKSWQQQ